jgi:hypothetical protein
VNEICPLQGSSEIRLPEIDSGAKPVVVVFTGSEELPSKQLFTYLPLATMISKNKGRGETMHVALGAVRFRKFTVFIENAFLDEDSTGTLWC